MTALSTTQKESDKEGGSGRSPTCPGVSLPLQVINDKIADLDSVGLANFRTEILLLAPDFIQMPCAFTKWEKEIAFPRNKIGVCMGQQKVCSSPPTLNMLELLAHSGKKSSPDMQTKYSRLTVRQIQSVKAR
ncbi:hypothetical protein MG293_016657 [Ovis ammon polii]|uniref:Uncharacterized protein n=1 Tax=Ovis ammon polii TaxID=230172 RepID=A0AAD4Y3U5_OVIAM|nr:hypothetical protein MG293_016657 [Ovis ammon polii]